MTTKKNPEPQPYIARLIVLGKTYTAKGKDVLSAISALDPGIAKGKGILTLIHGDKSRERVLQPGLVMKTFNTRGVFQEIARKRIATLFDL